MNLRDLAKRDAVHTIEGEQAGNTFCTLSDGVNTWGIPMILSDIGYELDTDGNRVAGRTCWATYIAERVYVEINGSKKILTPRKGWRLSWTDIDARQQEMFVIFAEPDKTVGWTRLFMAVQLKGDAA